MKRLLFLLMTVFYCGGMWAQCPQGGVTFYRQDHIDDFISEYPNCTEINSVIVDCIFLFDGINNLDGLRNIMSITNSLIIRDCDLTTLSGLENLNTIGNDLEIENNDALTVLTGLNGLVSVGRDLIVEKNANLINFTGLESLNSVGRNFNISENFDLIDMTGLKNLNSVGDNLWIDENNSLSSLAGLGSLSSIGIDLDVRNNYNLMTLTGLESLVSIGTDLIIQGNEALTTLISLGNLSSIGGQVSIFESDISTLEGLENISSIPGELSINKNYNLTTLIGLENLVSIGNLDIRNNYDLAVCNVPSICKYFEDGGTGIIGLNAPGCNSIGQIENSCISLPVEISTPLQARRQNQTALLTWRTETETNNSGFEIQKSKDGVQWERIGWQAGQGNTSTPYAYNYIDEQPFSNISYYRLKQVDFDGHFSYSNIASLEYHRTHANIYPNPVKDKLYISTDEQAIDDVLIFDTMGKQINASVTDNIIDVSLLPKGLYTVKVVIGEQYFYEKIVVQ